MHLRHQLVDGLEQEVEESKARGRYLSCLGELLQRVELETDGAALGACTVEDVAEVQDELQEVKAR